MPCKDKEKAREYSRNYYWLHRDEMNKYARNRRKLLKERGLCVICGIRKIVPGHISCAYCLYKETLQAKKYYQEHRWTLILKHRERRKKMREEGRCARCGAPLMEEESVYCINCSMTVWRQYPTRVGQGGLYEVNYEAVASKS